MVAMHSIISWVSSFPEQRTFGMKPTAAATTTTTTTTTAVRVLVGTRGFNDTRVAAGAGVLE
jgi:hypothetical protein